MSNREPPKDHVDEPGSYEASFDDAVRSKITWLRLLFMLIMAVIFCLGAMIGFLVSLLQFFWVLFNGEPKEELRMIGRQLGEYGREIALYMTFNTDVRPFPFDREWPSG